MAELFRLKDYTKIAEYLKQAESNLELKIIRKINDGATSYEQLRRNLMPAKPTNIDKAWDNLVSKGIVVKAVIKK